MEGILKKLFEKSRGGMIRFRAASALSAVLFMTVFFRVAVIEEKDVDFNSLFPESLKYFIVALVCTMLFSVLWKLFLEWKNRDTLAFEAVDIPVLAGLYGALSCMPMNAYFAMYIAGVIFALPCLCIYLLWIQGNRGLFSYVFSGFLKSFGISALVMILSSICLIGINALLLDISAGWWFVMSCGFWVFWLNLFLAYLPYHEEEVAAPWLLQILKKILVPAYLALMGILYLYIGKIIVTQTMPVGTMNWYASFAVAVYGLFYFCLHEEEEARIRNFLRWGAIALLPVMAVQAWGIYIRFDAYGLTAARYASIVCNMFGVLVVFYGIFRLPAKLLFLIAGGLSLLCTLTPLNIIDVPARDQGRRLEMLLIKNQIWDDSVLTPTNHISEEDEEGIRSAYQYLRYSSGAWRFPVVEKLRQDNRFVEFLNTESDSHRVYREYNRKEISVAGYRRMIPFSFHAEEGAPVGMLVITDDVKDITVDIRPYLTEIRREGKVEIQGTEANMTYQVSENQVLLFTWISYDWGRTPYFAADGYLLEK